MNLDNYFTGLNQIKALIEEELGDDFHKPQPGIVGRNELLIAVADLIEVVQELAKAQATMPSPARRD